MNKVPAFVPISHMRKRQAAILEQVKHRPIVLTHHNKAAAVMVDPIHWNLLLEELEDARDIGAIRQQENEEEQNQVVLIAVDEDEMRAWASGDHPL